MGGPNVDQLYTTLVEEIAKDGGNAIYTAKLVEKYKVSDKDVLRAIDFLGEIGEITTGKTSEMPSDCTKECPVDMKQCHPHCVSVSHRCHKHCITSTPTVLCHPHCKRLKTLECHAHCPGDRGIPKCHPHCDLSIPVKRHGHYIEKCPFFSVLIPETMDAPDFEKMGTFHFFVSMEKDVSTKSHQPSISQKKIVSQKPILQKPEKVRKKPLTCNISPELPDFDVDDDNLDMANKLFNLYDDDDDDDDEESSSASSDGVFSDLEDLVFNEKKASSNTSETYKPPRDSLDYMRLLKQDLLSINIPSEENDFRLLTRCVTKICFKYNVGMKSKRRSPRMRLFTCVCYRGPQPNMGRKKTYLTGCSFGLNFVLQDGKWLFNSKTSCLKHFPNCSSSIFHTAYLMKVVERFKYMITPMLAQNDKTPLEMAIVVVPEMKKKFEKEYRDEIDEIRDVIGEKILTLRRYYQNEHKDIFPKPELLNDISDSD